MLTAASAPGLPTLLLRAVLVEEDVRSVRPVGLWLSVSYIVLPAALGGLAVLLIRRRSSPLDGSEQ